MFAPSDCQNACDGEGVPTAKFGERHVVMYARISATYQVDRFKEIRAEIHEYYKHS